MGYPYWNDKSWDSEDNRKIRDRVHKWYLSRAWYESRCPLAWAREVEALFQDLYGRFPQVRLLRFGEDRGRLYIVVDGLNPAELEDLRRMVMRCEMKLAAKGAYLRPGELLSVRKQTVDPQTGRIQVTYPYHEFLYDES